MFPKVRGRLYARQVNVKTFWNQKELTWQRISVKGGGGTACVHTCKPLLKKLLMIKLSETRILSKVI